ncbi:MAG: hypothetical protein M1504_02865 [Candidatus Marsarchaeota archaeon]|nr:hypothetical protein [Candidatus Marsarchaeota archaeon]
MDPERNARIAVPLAILLMGSLMLLGGSLYITKTLSIFYGIGVGATIESLTYNAPLAPLLQSSAVNLTELHTGIIESYVGFVVALILVGASFLMLLRRYDRGTLGSAKRYSTLHSAFSIVYVLLFYLLYSSYSSFFLNEYMFILYVGMGLCIAVDLYLEYAVRTPAARKAHAKTSFSIDPSKPFSNMVMLQEELFPKMSGYLRIVDKHFNSAALTNFHRVVDNSMTNFTKITILTSSEMLDSSFENNIFDLKNELDSSGIALEIKIMEGKDSTEQHERILMDDRVAYKIPPFNIINKKSEHITKINFDDANKRFGYLYGRAIKLDNYIVKRGRDNDTHLGVGNQNKDKTTGDVPK